MASVISSSSQTMVKIECISEVTGLTWELCQSINDNKPEVQIPVGG